MLLEVLDNPNRLGYLIKRSKDLLKLNLKYSVVSKYAGRVLGSLGIGISLKVGFNLILYTFSKERIGKDSFKH